MSPESDLSRSATFLNEGPSGIVGGDAASGAKPSESNKPMASRLTDNVAADGSERALLALH